MSGSTMGTKPSSWHIKALGGNGIFFWGTIGQNKECQNNGTHRNNGTKHRKRQEVERICEFHCFAESRPIQFGTKGLQVPEKSLWLEVLVQTKSIGWLWNDFCSELTLGHPLSSIVSSCNHKVSCMALCTNQLSKKTQSGAKPAIHGEWLWSQCAVSRQHFFCLSGDTILVFDASRGRIRSIHRDERNPSVPVVTFIC